MHLLLLTINDVVWYSSHISGNLINPVKVMGPLMVSTGSDPEGYIHTRYVLDHDWSVRGIFWTGSLPRLKLFILRTYYGYLYV